MKENQIEAPIMERLNEVVMTTFPLFRNQWKNPPKGGQVNNMPSMTTQDDAMTIEELYKTFGHGTGPVQVGRQLFYDGAGDDVDVTDCYLAGQHWDALDLVEKHNILKLADNDFTRINDGIKEQNRKKAEKLEAKRKEEAEEKRLFKEWAKKQNEQVTPGQ